MATTNYLNLSLLDVGQKEKEVSINDNMLAIDAKSLRFLGDAPANPSTLGVPKGSSYYNTTTSKYRILTAAGTWIDAGGGSGTVTSVSGSGGTTGLSLSGGPITSSGTLTLGGTLGIANGGTGQITANAAVNALLPAQSGNSGRYLTTNGIDTSWGQLGARRSITSTSSGTFNITGISHLETINIARQAQFTGNVTYNLSFDALQSRTFFIILWDNGVTLPNTNQYTFVEIAGATPIASFTLTLPNTTYSSIVKVVHRPGGGWLIPS